MFIETTVNINNECSKKISYAARVSGKSCSEVVAILMKYDTNIGEEQVLTCRRVKYQKRDKAGHWKPLHVKFKPDDYERFLDLRKFRKMSVSLILSIAVNKYMRRLIRNGNPDNNQLNQYRILKRVINSIIYWIIIWGNPPDLDHISIRHL